MSSAPLEFLRELFECAVRAASAEERVPPHLPPVPSGRTVVVGAGKAAAAMARAVENSWSGALSGLVVTRYGHGVPCRWIEVVEASHPVPDAIGQRAARRTLELVSGLSADDLVLCLISGGGSALLTLPAEGVPLADKQAINRALLKSGATIGEMNCVRKHLSAIKGGRLAVRCAPAKVVTLMISDVPGDDPSVIASGPTVPDPTTSAEAEAILDRYAITVSDAVRAYLESPISETPKPGDRRFANVDNRMIATPAEALAQAAELAESRGVTAVVLGDDLEGEARQLGTEHAQLAQALAGERARPFVILSGGETTVTVRGTGRGGRNVEYLLALTIGLAGTPNVYALAADTDGIDGTEDNAGALAGPDTLARGRALGMTADDYLGNNDAYTFFSALGDLIITGPTLTNVNDFRAIYVA